MKSIDTALILAAGFGTRLRPLTQRMAKPSLPFFNKPLICHLLDRLAEYQISKVFVNLHYHGWSVRRAIRQYGVSQNVNVHFSHEPIILGTAGALGPIKTQLKESPFLLINGDVLTDIDFGQMMKQHQNSTDIIATVALHPDSTRHGFPPVGSRNNGLLSRFPYGPLANGTADWEGTFTGIHIIEPELLSYIEKRKYQCINSTIYPKAMADGYQIATYRHDGYWNDIGTPTRLQIAHAHVLQGRLSIPGVDPATDTFWMGSNTEIASSTRLMGTVVIGENCSIGEHCKLNDVIIWPDTKVPAHSSLENGILMPDHIFTPTYQRRNTP